MAEPAGNRSAEAIFADIDDIVLQVKRVTVKDAVNSQAEAMLGRRGDPQEGKHDRRVVRISYKGDEITDQFTHQEIVQLLGEHQRPGVFDQRKSDVMTAQALQRTSAGEGLLINADLPPAIFRQRRHYLDRDLKRLKG